jgi:predicted O-methyltransferase YrrM
MVSRAIRDAERYAQVVLDHRDVHPWHAYALRRRAERWHSWAPALWITRRFGFEAHIHETGCGCGTNLLWFAQQGFNRLSGSDLLPENLMAARQMLTLAGVEAQLWCEDGLRPAGPVDGVFDVVLALNWTYHVSHFVLDTFCARHVKSLRPRGLLVIDAVDVAYNDEPDNQYHTADRKLPRSQRRPSEYPIRLSTDQVDETAEKTGLRLIHRMRRHGGIPRAVYILQRPVSETRLLRTAA